MENVLESGMSNIFKTRAPTIHKRESRFLKSKKFRDHLNLKYKSNLKTRRLTFPIQIANVWFSSVVRKKIGERSAGSEVETGNSARKTCLLDLSSLRTKIEIHQTRLNEFCDIMLIYPPSTQNIKPATKQTAGTRA